MSQIWDPIPREILDEELSSVFSKLESATASKLIGAEFAKNGLDPFTAVIAAGAAGGWESWELAETTRQIQKALENEIGAFHQRLLGRLPGWKSLPRADGQPDLICPDRKIFVELKNKHNTVSGKDLASHYDNLLRNATGEYKTWTGVFAFIVDRPRNVPMTKPEFFTPSDNRIKQKKQADPRVLTMNGRILWAIATDSRAGLPPAPFGRLDAIDQLLRMVMESTVLRYPLLKEPPHRLSSEFTRSLGGEQ